MKGLAVGWWYHQERKHSVTKTGRQEDKCERTGNLRQHKAVGAEDSLCGVKWVNVLSGVSSSGGGIGATALGLKPLALDWFLKPGNVPAKVLPGTSEIPFPRPASQLLLFKRSMNIPHSWRHHYRTENSAIYQMFFFFFFFTEVKKL